MSTEPITVVPAAPGQTDLNDHDERMAARSSLLDRLGLGRGRQVLIRRDADHFALYTATADDGPGDPEPLVRMGAGGLDRVRGPAGFAATIDTTVIDPAATEAEARAGRKLLERLVDDGRADQLVVVAPHGGDIEVHTDRQAERVQRALAALGASAWFCQGWKPGGGAATRWHITSTDLHPGSFPLLASIAARGFRHAVSFHGFAIDGRGPDVLVGGAAPAPLKQVMAAVISQAVAGRGLQVGVAGSHDPLGGTEPANLVNWLTASGTDGIQIEQQLRARQEAWADIADAVALVYRAVLGAGAPQPSVPGQVAERGVG